MIELNPTQLSVPEMYKLLIGLVVPRPVALVSTKSAAGIGNLAPFSFFNAVCSNPPCLMISIVNRPDGSKKDTLRNIEETGEFVVNSANLCYRTQLVNCGADYPYGVDELSKVGLTPLASKLIKPDRVAEAAAHFECKVERLIELGDGSPGSCTLVIGKIVWLHIAEDVYSEGKILTEQLQPVARLGGSLYGSVSEIVSLSTPKL